MTPAEIGLARRIVALLPEEMIPLSRDVWGGTPGERRVIGRLLWQAVDDKADWLPVLEDYALLGWLITEARRRLDEPHLRTRWSKSGQRWEVYGDSAKWRNIVGYHAGVGETEVAALVAALEAAKEKS